MTDETDPAGGLWHRLSILVIPETIRRRYVLKFLVGLLIVVFGIAGIGGLNFILIQETVTTEQTEQLRSDGTTRALQQSQWVSEMESQTQLLSRTVQPVSLYLSDARDNLSPDIIAIHYINVRQNQVIASTDRARSGTRLSELAAPWTTALEGNVRLVRPDSSVWVTNRSYDRTAGEVVAFTSPARSGLSAVVVVASNQRLEDQFREDTSRRTTIYAASGEPLFIEGNRTGPINRTRLERVSGTSTAQIERNRDEMLVYAPISGSDWVAVTRAATAQLFQASNAVGQNVLAIIATSIFLLVIVGVVLGRHTIVPLNRLRKGTQELAANNFDIDLQTAREDEIGSLFADFRVMRDELKEQIEATRSAKEELESQRDNLKRLTTRLQLALDETNTGVWEWDPETETMSWDEASARLYGFDHGEFDGTLEDLADRLDTQTIADIRETLAAAVETGEDYEANYPISLPDGTTRWLRARGVVEYDDQDDPTGVIGVQTDITDRKEREQELEAAKEELEQSNEKLEQFAYVASHDLQEPLRMVSSYLDLLETEMADDLDDETAEYFDYAIDGANRMQEMIRGLLEYSRVQTRAEPFEAVDVNAVIEDTCTDLTMKIDQQDATVSAGDLPTVEADPSQLRQVFQNLIKNAIEHGGFGTTIEISATKTAVGTEFTVSDDGPGISPDRQSAIFDIFDKGGDSDGTGIGLAVCKQIIDRHGGEIWVDPGEDGATIRFTIPDPPG
jgi:PAS domain S-box-containing protein